MKLKCYSKKKISLLFFFTIQKKGQFPIKTMQTNCNFGDPTNSKIIFLFHANIMEERILPNRVIL